MDKKLQRFVVDTAYAAHVALLLEQSGKDLLATSALMTLVQANIAYLKSVGVVESEWDSIMARTREKLKKGVQRDAEQRRDAAQGKRSAASDVPHGVDRQEGQER